MLTEDQKAARKTGIGGSDAAAICGLNKYVTPLQVYLEKIDKAPEREENSYMYWGRRLESLIIDEYQRLTGFHVKWSPDTFRSEEYPHMIANLDGWVEEERIVVECKNVSAYRAKEFGEQMTDQVPTEYLMQMAHYAIVMDADRVDLAVLMGGNDFKVFSYKRNPGLEQQLIRIETDFWFNNVQKKVPPQPKTYEESVEMWPVSNDNTKVCDYDVMQSIDLIMDIKEQIKNLEEKESVHKAKICKLLEDASVLVSPDGKKLATWKAQESNRFVVGDFKEAYPDLVREFTKATKTRVLRFY